MTNNREGTGVYSLDFCEIKDNDFGNFKLRPLSHIEAVFRPENADLLKLVYEISQFSQENRSKILDNIKTTLALVRKNQK